MKIRYDNGQVFEEPFVYCYECGKRLQEIEACPILNFDDDGVYCLPETCHESSLHMPEKTREMLNGFKAGYLDGYKAGKRAKENAILIVRSRRFMSAEDEEAEKAELLNMKERGIIVLAPYMEYCGMVPADADIELIVKKIKEH